MEKQDLNNPISAEHRNSEIIAMFIGAFRIRGGRNLPSDETLQKYIGDIQRFVVFINHTPLHQVSVEQILSYYQFLRSQPGRGTGKQKFATSLGAFKRVRTLFLWLSTQADFDHKRMRGLVDCFVVPGGDQTAAATEQPPRPTPSYSSVLHVIKSIPKITMTDYRDRALLSLNVMTGARGGALATVPVNGLDLLELVLYQRPSDGCKTKYRNYIATPLMQFDPILLRCVQEWLEIYQGKGLDRLFPGIRETPNGPDFRRWTTSRQVHAVYQLRAAAAGVPVFQTHGVRRMVARVAHRVLPTTNQQIALRIAFGQKVNNTMGQKYLARGPEWAVEVLRDVDFSLAIEIFSSRGRLQELVKTDPTLVAEFFLKSICDSDFLDF